jgi:hypothetical protein
MSDINAARGNISDAMQLIEEGMAMIAKGRRLLKEIEDERMLDRVYSHPKVRAGKVPEVTPDMRRAIFAMKRQGETDHAIAQSLGLRNGGRVSEIMSGKR